MLAGKTFIVSGAGGAVGRHLAPGLIERGASLVLVGRDSAKLDAVAAASGSPERVQTVAGDVLSPETGAAAASTAIDRFGRLDGLVHLVGGFHAGTPVAATPLAVYEQQLQVNFFSAVTMTPPVLAHLKEGGVLLYMSSMAAEEPRPMLSAYAASKAALGAWVRGLQQEILPRRIRANMVSPTIVDTGDRAPGVGVPVEAIIEATAFLASDAAREVFGATLAVYGSQPPPGPPPPGNRQMGRPMDAAVPQTS